MMEFEVTVYFMDGTTFKLPYLVEAESPGEAQAKGRDAVHKMQINGEVTKVMDHVSVKPIYKELKEETKFSVHITYANGTGLMGENIKAESASEAIIKELQDGVSSQTVVSVTVVETTR